MKNIFSNKCLGFLASALLATISNVAWAQGTKQEVIQQIEQSFTDEQPVNVRMFVSKGISSGGGNFGYPKDGRQPELLDFLMFNPNFQSQDIATTMRFEQTPYLKQVGYEYISKSDLQASPEYRFVIKKLRSWQRMKNSKVLITLILDQLEELNFVYTSNQPSPCADHQVDRAAAEMDLLQIQAAAVFNGLFGTALIASVYQTAGLESRAGILIHEALRQVQNFHRGVLDTGTVMDITATIILLNPTESIELDYHPGLGEWLIRAKYISMPELVLEERCNEARTIKGLANVVAKCENLDGIKVDPPQFPRHLPLRTTDIRGNPRPAEELAEERRIRKFETYLDEINELAVEAVLARDYSKPRPQEIWDWVERGHDIALKRASYAFSSHTVKFQLAGVGLFRSQYQTAEDQVRNYVEGKATAGTKYTRAGIEGQKCRVRFMFRELHQYSYCYIPGQAPKVNFESLMAEECGTPDSGSLISNGISKNRSIYDGY